MPILPIKTSDYVTKQQGERGWKTQVWVTYTPQKCSPNFCNPHLFGGNEMDNKSENYMTVLVFNDVDFIACDYFNDIKYNFVYGCDTKFSKKYKNAIIKARQEQERLFVFRTTTTELAKKLYKKLKNEYKDNKKKLVIRLCE